LGVLGYWGYLPIQQAYPRAKEAALKAVELEDSLGEGHVALGLIHWLLDLDLAACERELRRGVELSPSSEFAHLWLAKFLLMIRGDRRSAFEEARLALDLDPVSLSTNFSMAWFWLFAGEYERAAEQARKTLELHPDAHHAYYVLGWVHTAGSQYAEALAAFEKAAAISRDVISLAYLAHAYGRAGQRSAAQALLAELLDRRQREYVPEFALALAHTGLGDLDRALESFERCYEERDSRLFWLPFVPCFDPLRSDPRYDELVRRLALSP
jgi:tetratricopeptide (TPR) repeat protein